MQISFAQIDKPGCKWGVRIAIRRGGPAHPSPGDQVQVAKRDGTTRTVVLGSVVMRDNGAFPGPAVYYTTVASTPRSRGIDRQYAAREADRVAAEANRSPESIERARLAAIEVGRELAEALAVAEELHAAYSEDGYDGEIEIRDAAIARIEAMRDTLEVHRRAYRRNFLTPRAPRTPNNAIVRDGEWIG